MVGGSVHRYAMPIPTVTGGIFDIWGSVGNCNILPFKKPKLRTYFLLKTVAHNIQSRKK